MGNTFSNVDEDYDNQQDTTAVPESAVAVQGDTLYDALRSELGTDHTVEPITISVPTRPGVSLVFAVDIEVDLFQAWVKRATNRRTKQTNARTLANIMLTNQHRGTLMKGQEVLAKDGSPLTFVHDELQKMMKAVGPNDAITKMFKLDGLVIQCMRQITEAAGFGDDVDEWDDEFGADNGPFENS